MPQTFSLLKGWENFYVITGSAAAGLTGLTFVVIALASDARMVRLSGLRAFITPIVIHFGSVLWLASLMSIPGHTALSLAITTGVTGLVLTAYSLMTAYRMYGMRLDYAPTPADWIWNAMLPSLCSLALLTGGGMVLRWPVPALYLVGAVTMAMLFIGVHNAWDLAVWITAERPGVREQLESPKPDDPPKQPLND